MKPNDESPAWRHPSDWTCNGDPEPPTWLLDPSGSSSEGESPPSGPSRRRVLALLSATAALAAASCQKLDDRGEILPYVNQPEDSPPGKARHYASFLPGCPGAPPVLVTTREGRPIKLEGNPEHPASMGALGAFGQSATLSLYDPDRLKSPRISGSDATWESADRAVRDALASATRQGRRVLLFTPSLASPTARLLVAEFLSAYPAVRHLPIEISHSGQVLAGQKQALGLEALPDPNWDPADVILSLEADFLGPCGRVRDQRGFARRRQPDSNAAGMNRLWCVESVMSVTGSCADHRLPLRPSLQGRFLLGLLHAIAVEAGAGPLAGHAELAGALAPHSFRKQAGELGLPEKTLAALTRDLLSHRGRSLVLAGDPLPAAVHTLAAAVNASLGSIGTTLEHGGRPAPGVATPEQVAGAVSEMASGAVAAVLNLGANPVYALPPDLRFADHLSRVPLVVSLSLLPDETSGRATCLLPAAHDLESWGDTDLHPGALTLQQPVMKPLFQARQAEECLLRWLPEMPGRASSYYAYLKSRWEREVYRESGSASPFPRFWTAALQDGFVGASRAAEAGGVPNPAGILSAIRTCGAAVPGPFDVVLLPSDHVYDGRFANNGWLQELPHPVTAHVWGNGAILGQEAAARLNFEEGDRIRVSLDDRSAILPVLLMPGVAEGVVGIHLGYGRGQAGSVGTGVGVDAGPLRRNGGGLSPWIYTGATLTRADGRSPVTRTQKHYDLQGREAILEATREHYRDHPDFARKEAPPDTSGSQGNWRYLTGQKWGMAIDLTLCTGCNACVVSCTAENNVPVVGPEQVARGREMQWIRVDRYYSGFRERAAETRVAHQPMLCQHCDNAPCENVCPVAATSHSPDGLNEMTYNRCIGTRYCANNCPYKVRRFNFFNNHEGLVSPRELVYNPEVTVRSRGVMEKCTFCVQRIREAQHGARLAGREVGDADLQTACQQACPAEAIVFGNLNDPRSRVHAQAESPRGYKVLSELGIKPSITYLARIRNPHPDLEA